MTAKEKKTAAVVGLGLLAWWLWPGDAATAAQTTIRTTDGTEVLIDPCFDPDSGAFLCVDEPIVPWAFPEWPEQEQI